MKTELKIVDFTFKDEYHLYEIITTNGTYKVLYEYGINDGTVSAYVCLYGKMLCELILTDDVYKSSWEKAGMDSFYGRLYIYNNTAIHLEDLLKD